MRTEMKPLPGVWSVGPRQESGERTEKMGWVGWVSRGGEITNKTDLEKQS